MRVVATRSYVALAMVLLLGLALVPVSSDDAGASESADSPSCPEAPAVAISETVGEEVPKEVAWIDNERGNALLEGIAGIHGDHPGEVLGQYDDHERQVVVVIVSPDGVSGEVLSEIGDVSQKYGIAVETAVGCFTRAELDEAEAKFLEDLVALAPTGVSGGIDYTTGRLLVVAEQGAPGVDWAEGFAAELGPVATYVAVDDLGRTGRLNDGSPHYGGARIEPVGGSTICSAGFAMDKNGGRWMATAAHCNKHSQWWIATNGLWNRYVNGAGGHYGYTRYRGIGSSSATDAELVGDGTHLYSRVIHVDPCCPTTRLVTAKANPALGTYVCHSGSVSTAHCSYKVTHTSWPICDGVCSSGYRATRSNGSAPAQDGDSGGSIYTKSGSHATIRGLLFAGGGGVVFEPVTEVESALGATTAVVCCNNDSW